MEAWQLYAHATLRPRREARYLLRRRMSEPTVWKFRRRENLCPCRYPNFGLSSPYPSLYTNYDTPTQGVSCKQRISLLILHQEVRICCGHDSNGNPNNFFELTEYYLGAPFLCHFLQFVSTLAILALARE